MTARRRDLVLGLATAGGALVGALITFPVAGGAVYGGAVGFVIGGLILGALGSAGPLADKAEAAPDEPLVVGSVLRRAFVRSVLTALAVAFGTAVAVVLLSGARTRGEEVAILAAGGLPFGFWLGATSLVELLAARRFRRSLGRGPLAAAVTFVVAFLACIFAGFQVVYIAAILETHSVEGALNEMPRLAHSLLRDRGVFSAMVAAFSAPVAAVALARLLRGGVLRHVLVAVFATLLLVAAPVSYLYDEERGMGLVTLGIAFAGALLLPLVAWLADAIERRFVTWTSREN